MIRPQDIAEAVRLRCCSVSPACLIPEIIFERPGDAL